MVKSKLEIAAQLQKPIQQFLDNEGACLGLTLVCGEVATEVIPLTLETIEVFRKKLLLVEAGLVLHRASTFKHGGIR